MAPYTFLSSNPSTLSLLAALQFITDPLHFLGDNCRLSLYIYNYIVHPISFLKDNKKRNAVYNSTFIRKRQTLEVSNTQAQGPMTQESRLCSVAVFEEELYPPTVWFC